jgi:5-(aminomethyl)-3-furanmethanol phosphate kinase
MGDIDRIRISETLYEMHCRGPTVIKLGGSFAFSPNLRDWIAAITRCTGRAVIVPGGGPFADAVRAAQAQMGFDDGAAHHMALLAMEQYGRAIKSLHEALSLADSLDSIRRGLADDQVPVWLPTPMALGAADIPPSWDVTSDSLAAWLAGKIGAARLLLIKQVETAHGTARVADLAARDIVDRAFANFHAASGVPTVILGPKDHAAVGRLLCGEPVGMRIIA